ncbi:esterase/lipase family protein [Kitasatospora arboriphila]
MTIPFQRTAATVRGAGAEAAALAHHLVRYPTGIPPERRPRPCPDRPAPPAAPPRHDPVLLLHGFVDNRAVFGPLRRDLHRHGWTHLHALNYSPLTRDVRAAAVLLARHVEWAAQAHGGRPVALVGHSLGGLIARYYVQRLGGHELVPEVVTLATPHEGTTAALLPNPFPITRQLRPGSDLLAELRLPHRAAPAASRPSAAGWTRWCCPAAAPGWTIPTWTPPTWPCPARATSDCSTHPRAVAVVRLALEAWAAGPLTERHAC